MLLMSCFVILPAIEVNQNAGLTVGWRRFHSIKAAQESQVCIDLFLHAIRKSVLRWGFAVQAAGWD